MPRGQNLERSLDPEELLLRARQRLHEDVISVERQMGKLDQQRQEMRDRLAELDRLLGSFHGPAGGAKADQGDAEEERGSDAQEIRAATRDLIKKLGRPVRRADILRALKKKGIVIASKSPGKAVNRALNRAKEEFEHVKEGYILRGSPLEDD